MSWELASFLIVAAVIVAGFAWYERSRPPSQVVALVAALAALAIAGRVAFAAFPNVKPTTDIVIFAGYALGGAPGFAVGALAALVSNFWFGQGPWTPWQMAAWGLCGVLGAALALGGRNTSRFVLAAVCGFAGVAYGALLNFSLMATYGGELSLARFGVLEGRAIPFDAAHAAANVAFALLAGPAMLRMLVRFRERFEWSRGGAEPEGRGRRGLVPGMRGGAAAASIAVLALAALAPTPAHASTIGAAGWLEGVQNADGGWGASPGDDSDLAITDWTMLGLEAAGRNPLDVARGGKTPVDYLRAHVETLESPGSLARTILALSGAGVDPRHFGGRNLLSALIGKRRDDGSFEGWPGSTAYAILALRGAGATGAAKPAAAWLRKVQNDDGGWGDTPGSPSTADGTGAAMMALAGSKAAQRGIGYLRVQQRTNGGFPLGNGFPVNSQSTAWAVQGILAAGGNPSSFKPAGKTPLDYLATTQQPDGHYRYAIPGNGTSALVANQSPVWTTAQALAATTETTFPIAEVPARAQPAKSAAPPKGSTSSPPAGSGSTGSAGGAGGPGSTGDTGSIAGLPPSAFAPGGAANPSGASPRSSNGAKPGPSPHTGGVAPGKAAPAGEAGSEPPPGSATGLGAPATEGSSADGEPSPATAPAGGGGGGGGGGSGAAVAILAGLLAGCLLFGVGWAARRGWMRWRYGL
jgi:energy-coupling factor transport system substrate-specific component